MLFWHLYNSFVPRNRTYFPEKIHTLLIVLHSLTQKLCLQLSIITIPEVPDTDSENTLHFPTKPSTCFHLYFQLGAEFLPDPRQTYNQLFSIYYVLSHSLFSVINNLLNGLIQKIICLCWALWGWDEGGINIYPIILTESERKSFHLLLLF